MPRARDRPFTQPDGRAHWSDQSLSLNRTIDYLLPISQTKLAEQDTVSVRPRRRGVWSGPFSSQLLRGPLKPAMQIDLAPPPPTPSHMIVPQRISADRKEPCGSFFFSLSCVGRARRFIKSALRGRLIAMAISISRKR